MGWGMYNKIMDDLKAKIKTLCESYPIQALYVFGSRSAEILSLLAHELPKNEESDLDVALLIDGHFSVRQKVDFAQALEELFKVNRVDLVILNDADTFLAANAVRGYRLYARNDYEADEFELYVLRRAGDLAQFERQRIDLILESR